MSHSQLPSIDLGLSEKLKDRTYRQAFFLGESSALIAKQLIALRKRRDLNQTQVADALETGQPVISRVERADYRNWSFNTLRKLAELYDARIRVYLEASEDVLGEYADEEEQETRIIVRTTGTTDHAQPINDYGVARSAIVRFDYVGAGDNNG